MEPLAPTRPAFDGSNPLPSGDRLIARVQYLSNLVELAIDLPRRSRKLVEALFSPPRRSADGRDLDEAITGVVATDEPAATNDADRQACEYQAEGDFVTFALWPTCWP